MNTHTKKFSGPLPYMHVAKWIQCNGSCFVQYETELSVANEVIEEHTSDLRNLYTSIVGEERVKEEVGRLSHSQLVSEIGKEVQQLKSEVNA